MCVPGRPSVQPMSSSSAIQAQAAVGMGTWAARVDIRASVMLSPIELWSAPVRTEGVLAWRS